MPPYLGCTDPGVPLDQRFDDAMTEFGKPWVRYSDFDSTRTSTDFHKGSTTTNMVLTGGSTSGITLDAFLDRRIGATRHANAGWAGIGTEIPDTFLFPLSKLSGIRFQLALTKTSPNMMFVRVILDSKGLPDSASHFVSIPSSLLNQEGGDIFCLWPADLRQSENMAEANRMPFDPAKLRRIRWEVALPPDSTAIDSATVAFKLSKVTFHKTAVQGVRRTAVNAFPLFARYHAGTLAIEGAGAGYYDAFEIRTLDGRGVATFAPSERMDISLPRGTYLLLGIGKTSLGTVRFTVLGSR